MTNQLDRVPTPRTDELYRKKYSDGWQQYLDMLDNARTLERELAGANALGMIRIQELTRVLAATQEKLVATERARDEAVATIEGASESEQWHQEILDLFARNGSGDYSPTPEEVEIINDGVTHVLRAVRAQAAKPWLKRYLGANARAEAAEEKLAAAEQHARVLQVMKDDLNKAWTREKSRAESLAEALRELLTVLDKLDGAPWLTKGLELSNAMSTASAALQPEKGTK